MYLFMYGRLLGDREVALPSLPKEKEILWDRKPTGGVAGGQMREGPTDRYGIKMGRSAAEKGTQAGHWFLKSPDGALRTVSRFHLGKIYKDRLLILPSIE